MDEIAALTPMFAGVSYERLEGYRSLQWPVAADGTDQPLLYTKGFAFPDGKARLFPVAWTAPVEQPDAEFDLQLNNGRLLEHFHEGNLTYRSAGIRSRTPDTFVEVSPELAAERGIESGTWVQLTSRYGQLRVRALVTDRVQGRDTVHADELDRESGQPADRQPHRSGDPHTGVQGGRRGDARVARDRGEPVAPHQPPLRPSHAAAGSRGRAQVAARRLSAAGLSAMARPIPLELPPRDEHAERTAQLDAARLQHADAVLAAYEVLQGLHDQGVLELLRGALGARDSIVEIAASTASAPESVRALRNLILLVQALGTIDPAALGDLIRAVPAAVARDTTKDARPPGLLRLFRVFLGRDFRRWLAAMMALMVAFGRSLSRTERR